MHNLIYFIYYLKYYETYFWEYLATKVHYTHTYLGMVLVRSQ